MRNFILFFFLRSTISVAYLRSMVKTFNLSGAHHSTIIIRGTLFCGTVMKICETNFCRFFGENSFYWPIRPNGYRWSLVLMIYQNKLMTDYAIWPGGSLNLFKFAPLNCGKTGAPLASSDTPLNDFLRSKDLSYFPLSVEINKSSIFSFPYLPFTQTHFIKPGLIGRIKESFAVYLFCHKKSIFLSSRSWSSMVGKTRRILFSFKMFKFLHQCSILKVLLIVIFCLLVFLQKIL